MAVLIQDDRQMFCLILASLIPTPFFLKDQRHNKYISKTEALAKLQRYCAYQDRCHQEVRGKLLELGIYGDDLEEIMADLITENFLNEERFARSFARGKFRIKKWGRLRINKELKAKNISPYSLKKAMTEIEGDEYWQTLIEVLEKKDALLKEVDDFKRKNRLVAYAMAKGFEANLIWEAVGQVWQNKNGGQDS